MRTETSASEGGASLAETALLITVVALAAAIALSFLGSSSDSSLDEAGKGIHQAPTGGADGGASGSGGSGGGGSGGGGTPGGAGPGGGSLGTTAPPTPTTTPGPPAPTTTTTTPTTTTWPTPPPATVALDDGRGVRSGSTRWNASADLQLDADGGGSMSGTATVLVESWKANGQRITATIEVAISADGSADIGTGPYSRSGSSRIEAVRYTVIDIELHDGREWDGDRPSIDIARP